MSTESQSDARRDGSPLDLENKNSGHPLNETDTPKYPGPSKPHNEVASKNRSKFVSRDNTTSLIVNYLPTAITNNALFDIFSPYGKVASARVMKDKTGYSFGYGFVNFHKESDAYKAMIHMDGKVIANKQLKVSFTRPSCDEAKATQIYITNLPRAITDDEFMKLFQPFGQIIKANILRDSLTRFPRGGFVRYAKREHASAAIAEINNKVLPGSVGSVRVVLARDHAKQKAIFLYGGFDDHRNRPPPSDIYFI